MTDIIHITLENEMDLVLAHKRTMALAERLGLTLATQTAFATAVSEVARTIIEHTDQGSLRLGIEGKLPKFALAAVVLFGSDAGVSQDNEGLLYARRLVPEFSFVKNEKTCTIQMTMGLSRSLRIDKQKIAQLQEYFEKDGPLNAYEEIKKRNDVLSRINSEKSDFISIAAHEIKTPITVVKAYAQMLRSFQHELNPKAAAIIDKLNLQTSKLASLVQQLMDVSQIENGTLIYNRERTGGNQFITDVISMLTNVHDAHTIQVLLDKDVELDIDRLRMEQVFTNLLGNAAKYSKSGTVISVQCKAADGFLTVSVKDQGMGMSSESLESIFKKFYRNKEVLSSHPGLGMGLYITSKIIVDHGGKIWAKSQPGKGSAFYISVPYIRCLIAS